VDVAAHTGEELLELQRHPNEWWARHARRLLQERGPDSELYGAARAMVYAPDTPPDQRLRFLWSMQAVGGLEIADAIGLMDHADADVRAWAVQLALDGRRAESALVRRLARAAAEDTSPVVRLYLAAALQRLPVEDRWEIAEGLLARAEDQADPNIPHMVWWGVEALVSADVERAARLARRSALPSIPRKVARRAMSVPDGPELFFREWERDPIPLEQLESLEGVLDAMAGERGASLPPSWPALREKLLASAGDDAVVEKIWSIAIAFGDEAAGEELARRVVDPERPAERRRENLSRLMAGSNAEEHAPLLLELLDDPAVRGEAIGHLAAFDLDGVSEALLALHAELSTEERSAALETLAARPAWALAALRAVEDGRVPRAEVSAAAARQMRSHGDAEIDALLDRVWGLVNDSDEARRAELDDWLARLAPQALAEADVSNGRAVFARTCQTCHTLFGQGDDVGPDLTGSNRRDLRYLLENVVDPNAIIPLDYRATEVFLLDGRAVTGLLREETASAVRLETENDEPVIARSDIDEMRLSLVSMMPTGQLQTLSFEEVRDLVAYLQQDTQVPRRARPGEEDLLFDGATLSGWWGGDLWSVEDGEIVGRAPEGIERNEFLVSELMLSDFRLALEVKLSPDDANAGIQLRSEPLQGGEMRGLQADVGAGWWGGLYEEQGRGLLHEAFEAPVRRGEWNLYEIEAVGSRVRTWINGVLCADLDDPSGAREGVLGLQLHSGGPREVRYRRLELELLP
jgi:putative heme-binding domain-containing protein